MTASDTTGQTEELFDELLASFTRYCKNKGDPSEDIPFPLPVLSFYDNQMRIVTLGLREHSDEDGYRQALLECLSVIPHLNINTSVLYFKLDDGGHGMLVASRKKMIRGALCPKEEPEPNTEIDVSMLDIATIDALKHYTESNTRMTIEYSWPLLETLQRRGHNVRLDREPTPILAEMDRI